MDGQSLLIWAETCPGRTRQEQDHGTSDWRWSLPPRRVTTTRRSHADRRASVAAQPPGARPAGRP